MLPAKNSRFDFKNCWFSEFPFGCEMYFGSPDLQCYRSVWVLSGCSADGAGYPDDRARGMLLNMNLRQVVINSLKKVLIMIYFHGFCVRV